jgi:DNA replication and repair protein RecF
VRLTIEGRALDAFGSQGQQRTAVLALKVAEYETMRSRAGDAPILLLDDVLSELDAERAGGFLTAVGTYEQAFLTTTELPDAPANAARFRITAATIQAC